MRRSRGPSPTAPAARATCTPPAAATRSVAAAPGRSSASYARLRPGPQGGSQPHAAAESASEKPHAGARRLSMRRMAARSIIALDDWACFKTCQFQVTPEIDRALMVKGFLVLGVTLI